MTKTSMFTVYDGKAQEHLEPFFSVNEETALRSFAELANKSGHPFHRFPEDFTLFYIGSFDPESGMVSGQAPIPLARAQALVKPELNMARLEELGLREVPIPPSEED